MQSQKRDLAYYARLNFKDAYTKAMEARKTNEYAQAVDYAWLCWQVLRVEEYNK